MLENTVAHLLENVIPAAEDYLAAENELTEAFARDGDPSAWKKEAQQAKRRAAEVGIAIDGLADRAATELGTTPDKIRSQVSPLCVIGDNQRTGAIERVCAVANAYKHSGPLNPKHPITSESDVLATGASYGVDAFSVGKYSGVEVLVNQKDGAVCKFLGDVPASVTGWFKFLASQGAALPSDEIIVCGLRVNSSP